MATVMSDGIAEDLIRSFVQFSCAESHTKTLIEKYTAELENGIVEVRDMDAVRAHTDKLNDLTEELTALAEVRRGVMKKLLDMYDGDTDQWCLVKHVGTGAYNLFEAYQASDDDPELYQMALEANKRFVKAMTRFLGLTISDCAACFHDKLKTERQGEM